MSRTRDARSAEFAVLLERAGFRRTPQREHVYRVLLSKPDHPTADEVFMRARKGMPEISMATVYNTLDALVQAHLVRVVNHDRGAARYCANMRPHHHFHCDVCGAAFDIEEPAATTLPRLDLPPGFQAQRFEVVVRGVCERCGRGRPGGA